MPAHERLKLESAKKKIADFTLDADFTIAPGERACLVGKSGSGKSTLLRLIAGLEELDAGKILLGSRDLTSLPVEKRGIGMVFQDQALFPSMDALENATFGLKIRGVSKPEREKLAGPWLERLGLAQRAHQPVALLSGGERQRVAFIRALIWKPALLLLDEPFSALDSSLRDVLRQDLLSLHADWPVPLLIVSHDPADIEKLATVKLQIDGEGSHRRVLSDGKR